MTEAPVEVDEIALRASIRMWMYTPAIQPHTVAGERQDLYLKIVAYAAQLPYEKVVELWHAQDSGIVGARRKVKGLIFKRLFTYPASILQIHDETVVHEDPVESGNAPKEQGDADRPR